MAHQYPVECLLPYDDKAGKVVRHFLMSLNAYVQYDPNPEYGYRRIVFLPSPDAQKEALRKNPLGETVFVVPSDVLSREEQARILDLIDRRLKELGVWPSPMNPPPSVAFIPKEGNALQQADAPFADEEHVESVEVIQEEEDIQPVAVVVGHPSAALTPAQARNATTPRRGRRPKADKVRA